LFGFHAWELFIVFIVNAWGWLGNWVVICFAMILGLWQVIFVTCNNVWEGGLEFGYKKRQFFLNVPDDQY